MPRADHSELLRTIGFSSAPGLLRVFEVIAPTTGLVFLVSGLWILVSVAPVVRRVRGRRSKSTSGQALRRVRPGRSWSPSVMR